MSYDVYLELQQFNTCEHCGNVTNNGKPVEVFDNNMTSNVSGIWTAAGAPLAEWGDAVPPKLASELSAPLDAAIAKLQTNPELYKPMEPSNGWGSVEGATRFLIELAVACREHPTATLKVSR